MHLKSQLLFYDGRLIQKHQTLSTIEPLCQKTCLRGFQPGQKQTKLYSHRRLLEGLNVQIEKEEKLYYICSKNKGTDQLHSYHHVQSLPRKRGRNSGLGVFTRRIAVVFDSFAAILKKIFVGELRKSFFENKKRLCASVKTSSSGSTHISLITECLADA